MKKSRSEIVCSIFALLLLFSCFAFVAQAAVHIVTVNPDGTFSPMWTWIRDGDTVEWQFHERTDTIIPVTCDGTSPSGCSTLLFTSNLQPNPNLTLQQLLDGSDFRMPAIMQRVRCGNIYRLAVHPEYRRRGLAGRLVSEVEECLALKGVKRITALVEKDHTWAVAFWESADYELDVRMVRFVHNL